MECDTNTRVKRGSAAGLPVDDGRVGTAGNRGHGPDDCRTPGSGKAMISGDGLDPGQRPLSDRSL
ncbi:hypothetical protein BRD15_05950 [Halobacteriales archaeon SW_6_65_15]|nr:MAG: hypothetical protein BRD15_05950 [Halobacteriales archaeon SW_6_65_15]